MRKRRVKKNTSDDKIVEKCNEMTKQSCQPPVWEDYGDLHDEILAGDVLALVVDVDRSTGSLQFFDASDTYLDMVGQDKKGMTIVNLEQEVRVVCYGSCRVGKVSRV